MVAQIVSADTGDDRPTEYSNQRKVARDASSGRLWATYTRENVSAIKQVWVAYSDNEGKTWAEEAITDAGADQEHPALAIDAWGTVHVVWSAGDTGTYSSYNIMYRCRATNWEEAELVTDADGNQLEPNIAVDTSGYVHVVWDGYTWGDAPSQRNIQYRKRTSSWQAQEGITDIAAHQEEPAIALDDSNNVHVVWRGMGWGASTAHYNIQYRKRTDSWQEQEAITDLAEHQSGPSIVIDAEQYVHVAWRGPGWGISYPTVSQIVYRQRTTSWQDIQQITDSSMGQYDPSLNIDGDGRPTAVWDGRGWGINIDVYNIQMCKRNGGSWGIPISVTDEAEAQEYPTLAENVAYILWGGAAVGEYNVYFDADYGTLDGTLAGPHLMACTIPNAAGRAAAIPEYGDRASWRTDVDDGATHADDWAAGDTHHPAVTLGGGSAAELTLSGQELTLAEVLTPTEHTAIGDAAPHHAAVTLAASADELLGLSTQELSLDTQAANTVLRGPTSGAAAAPTFGALVNADLPDPLAFKTAATPLTIAAGAVTATQNLHTITSEAGTTDDLDTITAAADRTLLLLQATATHTITVKHGTGNISLNGAADFTLSGNKALLLYWTGTVWADLGSGATGGSAHTILSVTHTDTDTTAPDDGDVLTWDETAGEWKAAAAPGAGGDADTLDGLHADATGAADAHVVATDANGDAKVVDLTATGGLNVGTATGAGAGDVSGSGELTMTGYGQSRISRSYMNDGAWEVAPSSSTYFDVAIPQAPFVMLLSVGGYGIASSGNVIGLYHIAGYGNSSVNTIIRTIDTSTGTGSISCAWQAAGVLRVTITNTHDTRRKSGYWRAVLVTA